MFPFTVIQITGTPHVDDGPTRPTLPRRLMQIRRIIYVLFPVVSISLIKLCLILLTFSLFHIFFSPRARTAGAERYDLIALKRVLMILFVLPWSFGSAFFMLGGEAFSQLELREGGVWKSDNTQCRIRHFFNSIISPLASLNYSLLQKKRKRKTFIHSMSVKGPNRKEGKISILKIK